MRLLIDMTDVLEFLQRRESVSGVQRVVAETAPLLRPGPHVTYVFLDRHSGRFIALTNDERVSLVDEGARSRSSLSRDELADLASRTLDRGRTAEPIALDASMSLLFLGALWINDALMLAARAAHATGVRIVALLYDLTPVLETGHTAAVNKLFDRYLTLLLDVASRVPAISRSSRADFEAYASERGRIAPQGSATGLPCGLNPRGRDLKDRPWPRNYALFVGTIESRKNHLLALRVWERLIEEHGADAVPDLVCVGRLGWNAGQFLREYVHSAGLGGKVSVLSSSVGDDDLACFYAHADFTLYPSRYEGWGLPVSESLAFGKLPVVARTSSLPEAGGDLAVYFESDDISDCVRAIKVNALDEGRRQELVERIRTSHAVGITWKHVADEIEREVGLAERRDPVFPEIELGREYMLAVGQPPPDEGYGDQYLDYLVHEGLTPMLRQPRGDRDYEIVDGAVIGTFGSPQAWGNQARPGQYSEFRLTRPTDGDLTLLVSTRAMPGLATIQVSGPGGPQIEDVYLGSVITIPLGAGKAGEPAQATLTVTDAHDSIEGFLGIRSFVVLETEDKETRILALEAAAVALRQELDFIQGTRSWKVTAPLRKWKGRGA